MLHIMTNTGWRPIESTRVHVAPLLTYAQAYGAAHAQKMEKLQADHDRSMTESKRRAIRREMDFEQRLFDQNCAKPGGYRRDN